MVEGLDNILNNLEQYTRELKAKQQEALDRASQVIENKAKENCPVDDGILRASITHKVKEDGSSTIGTGVEYAPYVHQGTGLYAVNGDGRKTPWVYTTADGKTYKTVGQKPQPFLLDAVLSEMTEVLRQFEEVMR